MGILLRGQPAASFVAEAMVDADGVNALDKCNGPAREAVVAVLKLRGLLTVHMFGYGMSACMRKGPPSAWPKDHLWSEDWKNVNCAACLLGRDMPHTYTIAADGKSITCLRCRRTSYHPKDVEHRYCGHCKVFHDELWPPARRWWIDHPEPKDIRLHEHPKMQADLSVPPDHVIIDRDAYEQLIKVYGMFPPLE